MALIKSRGIEFPFGPALMSDFFNGDRFLGRDVFLPEKMPAVNIEENEKFFNIEMVAPGMKRENFNIAIDNGIITISAEKKEEELEERKNYTRKEFSFESFTRSFNLPDNIVEDKIEAVYNEGLLKLILPKKEVTLAKAKHIEIR